jgi:hypothetical protein
MAKTMAKLQAQSKKTSPKRTNTRTNVKKKTASRARPKAKARARQRFNVSHFREKDFLADGLRTYASYRDLGMSKATGGLLQAHVIRLLPPCDPAVVSKRHYHDEVVTMRKGAAWLQPPRIKHTVLDYSDDCELLEIIVPAEFKTVELE